MKKNLTTLTLAFILFISTLTPALADGRYQCHGCTCNQYKYFVDIDLVNYSGDTPITTMGPFDTYGEAQQAADDYVYYYPEDTYNIYDAQYCF